MKKFISAILSIAMILSCMSIGVYAEDTTPVISSTVYTVDTEAKTISGVAPLTTVGLFKTNITGAETVEVVNVDGSEMAESAYATENVSALIDGEIYTIDVEYPYDPIHTYGKYYRADGDVLFEKLSSQFNSTVDNQAVRGNSGFAYATSGYKLGVAKDTAPSVGADNKTVITKQTENGQPVYIIENDAPRYAFLRSHYSSASYATQTQSELTDITNGKYSVTTVSFKTDKMGNFSLHHNAAGSATGFKGDGAFERFTYDGNAKYIPNAIHFTEDGTVKIGGTYTNGEDATDRSAAHTTSATWEAGKEYTVSVVQKVNDGGSRYGKVYGVYLDGEKIFPMGNESKDNSNHFAYDSSNGSYSMTTRGSDYKYHGGISAILIGAAPVDGDNIKLTLSDVKVYTVGAPSDYNASIDKDLTLEDTTDVTIEEDNAEITVSAIKTVADLKAEYSDVVMGVYNDNNTLADEAETLATGMTVKIASQDGLQAKTYDLTIDLSGVLPMPAETSNYTVDSAAKTVSGVAPLTRVSDFLANFDNGDLMSVLHIDGSVATGDVYATENVSLEAPNGEIYTIDVEYPYDPIHTYGKYYRADGDVLFEKLSSQFNSTVDNQAVRGNSGFAYATSGYKLGVVKDTAPSVGADNKTVITKQTENGQPVYIIENDAPRYAFLRSHYSSASYATQTQSELTDITNGKYSVTTVSFKTDKMGNFSLHHNAAGSATGFKGDGAFERFTYDGNAKYIPNAIHFTEDGTVKIGGTYTNGEDATDRSAAHTTSATWEANKEYTVSVVQKVNDGGSRYGKVYGVYLDGEKIFPMGNEAKDSSNHFAYDSSNGSYSMTTRGSDYKYHGGISAILVGAAPVDGDSIKLTLSDVKVYTVGAPSDYNGNIDKGITLEDATDITVSENNAEITTSTEETVASLKAKYDDVIMVVYNEDGTVAEDGLNLATGMTVKIASQDALHVKTYDLVAIKPVSTEFPESTVYTVDTAAKTVSGVAPLTKVSDFLANFDNGDLMEVVHIDETKMADDAYATEHVSLKAPNGDIYKINVKYGYAPIKNEGSALSDNAEIYNIAANVIDNNDLANGGFAKLQTYAKIGYGSDNAAPSNTETQTVKATKQSIGGEPVYVMENDSNNYAYLRSHYTESTNYSTTLNSAIDSWTQNPIVTSVEFEADKLGNISVFNNTPVRNASKNITKGDSGIDGLIYSVEAPYAPNSVHFLEDGTVKLGGIYSNYLTSVRTPIQETDFTWEPGKKYTVSIVQRYLRGTRNAYVDGVYVNGVKIFPNDKTVSYEGGRVALQSDGTFKIGTKDSSLTHGGGLSSIMIGTAPKTADDNLKVYLSDVKVYSVAEYNPALDSKIALASKNNTVRVDNEKEVIYCMGAVSASDFNTTAKLKVENGYVKVVSLDGLVAKVYKIETERVQKSFLNGVEGVEIDSLTEAQDKVCFNVNLDTTSVMDGLTPIVILAVYDKEIGLMEYVPSTGTKYSGEITNYKPEVDISAYNKENIFLRGFIWDGLNTLTPLTGLTELR